MHEIGHLIGLDHPGHGTPACSTGGEAACYAAADGSDTGIMARGSVMLPEYADAWRKAAAQLTSTQKNDWIVSINKQSRVNIAKANPESTPFAESRRIATEVENRWRTRSQGISMAGWRAE